MSLSESEGVWGNKEAISYRRERNPVQQQQPERKPMKGHKTAKSGHILGLVPRELPLVIINYLFLFIN